MNAHAVSLIGLISEPQLNGFKVVGARIAASYQLSGFYCMPCRDTSKADTAAPWLA